MEQRERKSEHGLELFLDGKDGGPSFIGHLLVDVVFTKRENRYQVSSAEFVRYLRISATGRRAHAEWQS